MRDSRIKRMLLLVCFIIMIPLFTILNDPNNQSKFLADVDLPLRQNNYSGGSCVHASMVTILRWQNQMSLADRWLNMYSGGETSGGLIAKCKSNKLDVEYTLNGSPEFLEWCSRTNRGAVIFYYPAHCVSFLGYLTQRDNAGNTTEMAYILDNNSTNRFQTIEKSKFLSAWKGYGGFALTTVYSPTPQRPN